MEDQVPLKTADQILEEIFSALSEPVPSSTTVSCDATSLHTKDSDSTAEKLTISQDPVAVTAAMMDTTEVVIGEKKEKKKKKKKEKKKDKKKEKKKEKKKKKTKSEEEKQSREKLKENKSNVTSKVMEKCETKVSIDVEADKEITKPQIREIPKSRERSRDEVKSTSYTKVNARGDAKKEAKSDAKSPVKSQVKPQVKGPTKAEVKPEAKSSRSHDERTTRQVDTKEQRKDHQPKRRSSRSRSPISRRSRRSRSRSPRRKRRLRSRSKSRSPAYHRKRSRSPVAPKRPSPPKSPRIDKAQLLEFARQNLKRMQETGSLPAGIVLPNPPTEVVPASTQFTGKTVAELTDYCKNLMADGSDDGDSQKKESETTFTRHPFQIKPRTDTIVMNIRNAVALPIRKPEERVVAQAQLKQQFPVSSGQQHLELEWVPVPLPPSTHKETNKKVANTAAVAPTPRASLPPPDPPVADIGSIVAKRISSIRKLQENQFDVEARLELEQADSMTQSWATYHHTNPMTGEPMPELIDWSGAPQAWARKDQFSNAAPVAGGVGMKLLQKMGWQPGEGLGRNKEGTLEPLSLDIKMDKKGLVSKEELGPLRATPGIKLIQEFQGKHPVSILHELCTKKHWDPPAFEQVADIGPDHLKHFLFKVTVNRVDYQPCLASTTKKDAKAQAAAACLQALGVFAPPP